MRKTHLISHPHCVRGQRFANENVYYVFTIYIYIYIICSPLMWLLGQAAWSFIHGGFFVCVCVAKYDNLLPHFPCFLNVFLWDLMRPSIRFFRDPHERTRRSGTARRALYSRILHSAARTWFWQLYSCVRRINSFAAALYIKGNSIYTRGSRKTEHIFSLGCVGSQSQ